VACVRPTGQHRSSSTAGLLPATELELFPPAAWARSIRVYRSPARVRPRWAGWPEGECGLVPILGPKGIEFRIVIQVHARFQGCHGQELGQAPLLRILCRVHDVASDGLDGVRQGMSARVQRLVAQEAKERSQHGRNRLEEKKARRRFFAAESP